MSEKERLISLLMKNNDTGDDDNDENYREIADTLTCLQDYAYKTFQIIGMQDRYNILSYYFSQDCSKFPTVLNEILNNNKNFYNSEVERLNNEQDIQEDEDEL